jgi:hypothetical protein
MQTPPTVPIASRAGGFLRLGAPFRYESLTPKTFFLPNGPAFPSLIPFPRRR